MTQADSATALRMSLDSPGGDLADWSTPPDSFVMLREHQRAAGCTDLAACGVCVALARTWLYDEAERRWPS